MAERILDVDVTFFRGAKSDCEPGSLPLGYYFSAINMLNVGGVLSCRPGYKCWAKLPEGKLQGATLFRPKVGLEQVLVAIDGIIYVSEYPFLKYRVLDNVLMSPTAKQIFWQQTTQAARRLTTDFSSAIEVIAPREVVFIQDGGFTAPAWYDGSQSGHVRNNAFETPTGGPMAWIGDRLWVSSGRQVFASDISNGFSFREQIYLGGVNSLLFKNEVTAFAKTPSLEFPQLIVFTDSEASLVQASIRDRSTWPTTDGFQIEIFNIGCSSQRSVTSHFGQLTWFSKAGIVFWDSATASKISGRLPLRDSEMSISKTRLMDDLSLVAAASFGPYLLMSTPADDLFNKHTWVLNSSSIETLNDSSGPSWAGFWLGTRPVEWFYGSIAGADRIYHVSADADGQNRLWEIFRPERLDNGCPIMWAVETRGFFGQTSQTKKIPGTDCRFMFADIKLMGIEEDLDIGAFFAGGVRGSYIPIMAKRISVERGSLSWDQEITATSELFGFKPQSRGVRTQDANQISTETDSGACSIESPDLDNLDENFQMLIVGHGPATLRMIRTFAMTVPEDVSGDDKACKNEEPTNVIRFDGQGAKSLSFEESFLELSLREVQRFTSNQTSTVTQYGLSAVGVGFSESVVSQQAADRVATIIATKQAESELATALAPTLSIGEGL
jgi:hypothetical protein